MTKYEPLDKRKDSPLVRVEQSWPPGHRDPGRIVRTSPQSIVFEKHDEQYAISSLLVFKYPDGRLSVNRWVIAKAKGHLK